MKNKSQLYTWAGLYVLCLIFGFLPVTEQSSSLQIFRLILSLGFFVPAGLLLTNALQNRDSKLLKLLRRCSGISLIGTFLLLIVTILCMVAAEELGILLQVLLNLINPPLVCGQNYALTLFLWACLFFATFIPKNPQKS
ncbi:MAG: hypothetical protein J6Q54_06080 [Oscillospiraceae bacterium]|nr:hypothetical protein [Oscillospiraceae bacterium]